MAKIPTETITVDYNGRELPCRLPSSWEKYRWEFMRRNPEYKKDYSEFHMMLKKKGCPPYQPQKNGRLVLVTEDSFDDEVKNKKKELLCKYDIKELYNPEKSYDELTDHASSNFEKAININSACRIELFFMALRGSGLKTESPDNAPMKLNIHIDFGNVNNIDSLKQRLSDIIDTHVLNNEIHKNRKNNVPLESILLAGDMKAQGYTRAEIGQKIDPNRFREKPDSVIRSVSDYVKSYNELIHGGYKKLVYP